MNRRRFTLAFAGSAGAAALPLFAQQPGRAYRVGVLLSADQVIE